MKIYYKVEMNKGYIPNDKVRHNGIAFEDYGLNNFGISNVGKSNELRGKFGEDLRFNKVKRTKFIIKLINEIKSSEKYKKIVSDGYHKALYLNFNRDGIDCFISR